MKNAVLPSASPQLYSYGSNEVRAEHASLQMDSKIDFYGNGFCIDSGILYNSHDQLGVGGSAVPSQPPTDYHSRHSPSLITFKRLDDISQQPSSLGRRLPLRQFEAETMTAQNARKRPTELSDVIPNIRYNHHVLSCTPDLSDRMANKKPVCLKRQWQLDEASREIQRQRVPVRKSQKLSDKITALQKLVSPFGKTDTASVLQEASISIKILQEQIQMLSTPSLSTKSLHSQRTGEEHELRSRGLCLVPLSFTNKLTKKDLFEEQATTRKLICSEACDTERLA